MFGADVPYILNLSEYIQVLKESSELEVFKALVYLENKYFTLNPKEKLEEKKEEEEKVEEV